MTWSEALLWLLGGALTLAAGLFDDAGFVVPGYVQVVGALAVALGGALVVVWRRGGATRRMLGGLAYLGTAVVTSAVVAAGPPGEVFIPLYGFVAVVAALHMRPVVAARHLVVIVLATGLLVALGVVSLFRAAILLSVVVAMAAVVNDLATRHEEDVAVHERQEMWRAAMAGILAHDIRSPLSVVQGVLATLAEDEDRLDATTRAELLSAADRQAQRIEVLSEDLLTLERVRHGRLALEPEDVTAGDLVAEVAAAHGAPVTLDVPDRLRLQVDPDRITQVLLNLVRNAAVHGEQPVELRARADGDGWVRLEVRDHGPGVPGELQEGLFDEFTHGGRPDSVGLGLWIVRMLTEAHGGRVAYEDADPGARFVVWLPTSAEAAPIVGDSRHAAEGTA